MPPSGNLLLLGHFYLACVVKFCWYKDNRENDISFTEKRTLMINTVQSTIGGAKGNVKSERRGRSQSAKPEQPTKLEENEFKLVQPPLRRLVSARPGRHQRAQVTELEFSMSPWQFYARLSNLRLKIFVSWDKNMLQLTDLQKRETLLRHWQKVLKSRAEKQNNKCCNSINITEPMNNWCSSRNDWNNADYYWITLSEVSWS